MPKRTDIHRILLIGSGPIVIGQACEFDYSGTQACKALREEGYEVILVNSNPATIMTDPEMADRTYIEPLNVETLTRIIERERPDAVLPTVGGQTGLNLGKDLAEQGVLEKYGCELIGAKLDAIRKAEDRGLFKDTMIAAGLDLPRSMVCHNIEEAQAFGEELGYKAIIRPAYTLGGSGAGVAFNKDEYQAAVAAGLSASPITEVLIEESILGWKEYELEVMRDTKDNVVIICSIENIDPMGVHTGDSITVAPAQTLTDREYQEMRDAAITCIRAIGVDTGGSNVQFAVCPQTGRLVVIEMNPRVSRSSALASKATGFPIAKIAAKLAVGYTLNEIRNDITRETPASFEPTIDYVVTKIPRWAFEKFPGAKDDLTVQMKSVGEAMSIGRTFKESFQKCLRSLEIGRFGFGGDGKDPAIPESGKREALDDLLNIIRVGRPGRMLNIAQALRLGATVEELAASTLMDPWFLRQMREIILEETALRDANPEDAATMRRAKEFGFSDPQLAYLWGKTPGEVRELRKKLGVIPTYKLVDTCAAEFEAYTPYYYSTYGDEDEVRPSDREKIMIIGGGPNRIGQGIEFDYCCCHAAFALSADGFETIMVNSNPETVSTDYDTSDRLYFEPVTLEDVLNIVEREKPIGVIVQFGGQTPLNLANALEAAGVPIIGTSPRSIARAEDRKEFRELVQKLGLLQTANETATSLEEARAVAADIGYPVVVRPSFVLGGRAMEIVYDEEALDRYMTFAVEASPEHPILVDKFLEDATELDVDALSDGTDVIVAGIMQHVEQAGVHSGDSACILPPYELDPVIIERVKEQTRALARELEVIGLMNIQFAISAGGELYILEVNPRASRTVPFVSKATGVSLAKIAARVMAGKTLRELGITEDPVPSFFSAKEVVLPFIKFPGVDILLGPEMRSTGEVMGIDQTMGMAFAKSQTAAGNALPMEGTVFLSLNRQDKEHMGSLGADLAALGFSIVATQGTAEALRAQGIECREVFKVNEGRPNVVDLTINGEIDWIINTPLGEKSQYDEKSIRRTALEHGLPTMTTLAAAKAAVHGLRAMKAGAPSVVSLQEYHAAMTPQEA